MQGGSEADSLIEATVDGTALSAKNPGAAVAGRHSRQLIPAAILVASLALWISSIPQIHPANMTWLGLASVLPVEFYLAIGLLLVGYAWAIVQRPLPVTLLILYNVLLIVEVHATPQIVFPEPVASLIYKHAGVVDYIVRHGAVDPSAASALQPYQNWPGFFVLSALITEAGGFTGALQYAGWAPILMNLLFLGAMLLVFRNETADRRHIWVALWIYAIGSWIAEDFFVPEALASFLFLCSIAVVRSRYRAGVPVWDWPVVPAAVQNSRAATFLRRLIPPERRSRPRGRSEMAGTLALLALLAAAIVSSHQLTPFALLFAYAALVLTGRLSLRWLPIALAVVIGAWLIGPAWPWVSTNTSSVFGSLFAPFTNATSGFKGHGPIPSSVVVEEDLAKIGQLLFLLAALIGFTRLLRRRRLNIAFVVLAVSPLALIPLNAYGGEVLFRAFYFSSPFLCYFAAEPLLPPLSRLKLPAALPLLLVSAPICFGLLVLNYVDAKSNYIPRDEVAAYSYLLAHSRPGSLLVTGAGADPIYFKDYEHFSYSEVLYTLKPLPDRHPMQRVVGMVRGRHPAAYLMFTTTGYEGAVIANTAPPSLLARLRSEAYNSPLWHVVWHSQNAVIFQFQNVNVTY